MTIRTKQTLKNYIVDFCRQNHVSINRLFLDAEISTATMKTLKENRISIKNYFRLAEAMNLHSVLPVEYYLLKLKNIIESKK